MKTALFWILAILLAGAAMVYQKATGPTYEKTGEVTLNDQAIQYSLGRTHGGEGDQPVTVTVGDRKVGGIVEWKRYPIDDMYTTVYMGKKDGDLTAMLPHQPPAGKIQYRVILFEGDDIVILPDSTGLVTRFKGGVPTGVLLPHVLLMILSMIMALRTGLEAFRRDGNLKRLTVITFLVLLLGGGILGPIVQKYAFGVLWAGVPFGWDLTDNKLLMTLIGWLIALIAVFRTPPRVARVVVIMATLITISIYLIPHSMAGSELDYAAYDSTGVIDNIPH
jgi:hypothetical protein